LRGAISAKWNIDPPDIVLNQTPKIELGELATPVCFELAKRLRKSPRAAAEELVQACGPVPGVSKLETAGAGYLNFFLDRGHVLRGGAEEVATGRFQGFAAETGKVIVEHTNINPNKAAHIGHLRNAAIGDTFVRLVRAIGHPVEIQNYIDNTGVQVADVIVGFKYLEKKSLDDVKALIDQGKFDYYCWDLYARVGSFYEAEDP
jgi:arginyl-tRNA synthetase